MKHRLYNKQERSSSLLLATLIAFFISLFFIIQLSIAPESRIGKPVIIDFTQPINQATSTTSDKKALESTPDSTKSKFPDPGAPPPSKIFLPPEPNKNH